MGLLTWLGPASCLLGTAASVARLRQPLQAAADRKLCLAEGSTASTALLLLVIHVLQAMLRQPAGVADPLSLMMLD